MVGHKHWVQNAYWTFRLKEPVFVFIILLTVLLIEEVSEK